MTPRPGKPHIRREHGLWFLRIAPEKHVFRDRHGRLTTVLTERVEVGFPAAWGGGFPRHNLATYCLRRPPS